MAGNEKKKKKRRQGSDGCIGKNMRKKKNRER